MNITIEEMCKWMPELIQISKQAGAAILQVYNSDDLGIELKEDQSPLTLADQLANDIIIKGLKKLTPTIPIITEETQEIPYLIRSQYEYFWLVDPLDGTKEFIKKNGEFTVNIALIHEQKSILGVVYVPVSDTCFYASQGSGAFKEVNNNSLEIKCNPFTLDDHHLKVVASRSHLNEETQEILAKLNAPHIIQRGSSLKFLTIAEGEADYYPRIAPTMEWDTAAAQAILEEAGGSVINYQTGESLLYNKENQLNPYFVAQGILTS